MSVLGRLAARIDAPVVAGAEHVVIGRRIGSEGHKHYAGSAVLSAGGEALAVARALLIELHEGSTLPRARGLRPRGPRAAPRAAAARAPGR